jgi:CRISPR-associated protein Csb1
MTSAAETVTVSRLRAWADEVHDPEAPVALHLRQDLEPVEGKGAVIFPPTYADIGYNIDVLTDGTQVATIDSVGSQANRMEPIFLRPDLANLVPQIDIVYGNDRTVSLLKAGHRLGDAIVRCTELQAEAQQAFRAFLERGDATEIARISPTSIVHGAWDSRDTQAKLPRILQSVIRAWDVSDLKRAAQYGPAIDYAAAGVFSDEDKEKAQGNTKNPLAQRGYVHVPSTGQHGGIVASGPIRRDVTVNLSALRKLDGESGQALRRYILGLALIEAVEPLDPDLRSGCLLVEDPASPPVWSAVRRRGGRSLITLSPEVVKEFATSSAGEFGVGKNRRLTFDPKRAREDVADKADKKSKQKST